MSFSYQNIKADLKNILKTEKKKRRKLYQNNIQICNIVYKPFEGIQTILSNFKI